MFIAAQARNIAEEKMNHRYYKIYKRYARKIMREIAWKCSRGKTRHQFSGENGEVLDQIAEELREVGYNVNVYSAAANTANDGMCKIDIMWG